MKYYIEVKESADKQWVVTIHSKANRKVIFTSETYKSKATATRTAKNICDELGYCETGIVYHKPPKPPTTKLGR